MAKYLAKIYSWENPHLCYSDIELERGDRIVLKKDEFQSEIGTVEAVGVETREKPNCSVVRKATEKDIEVFEKNEDKKKEILGTCKEEVKRLGLGMKLVDARISLDSSNVVIAFTADERVDFRELVKNLSKIFRRSVRMHQIGSRDEARNLGGCGVCGRGLCCLRFSGNLPSISIDMARIQQIAHRGSERISGICGRLMCCLSYESPQYQEMMVGMPELHSSVNTPQGKGEVIEINALTQEIKTRLLDGKYVVFKKKDIN
ncbi:MAG: PSP1 domain protein [Candidatus Moranbacteria bacterium GW2011_GWE1_49_15]|nr:MAG: PSP1 domain protein [Candidatus Moranbacteria bacterium GW2011_GWE2_47_10]KKW07511.1 MAG: PSP1 domain protein [Candidatus Moranbacteria bacterium GW2011_GWE1_49_15]HBP00864.1 stage 0 sporulation protein [Candidatus Moranbacteria bacterium]